MGAHIVHRQVVKQNEAGARRAYEQDEHVLCFPLEHFLIESLLRAFLGRVGKKSFSGLVVAHNELPKAEGQSSPLFVDELTRFSHRRNRVVHRLWARANNAMNARLEPARRATFITCGLFIEWLETFSEEIAESGFEYE